MNNLGDTILSKSRIELALGDQKLLHLTAYEIKNAQKENEVKSLNQKYSNGSLVTKQ